MSISMVKQSILPRSRRRDELSRMTDAYRVNRKVISPNRCSIFFSSSPTFHLYFLNNQFKCNSLLYYSNYYYIITIPLHYFFVYKYIYIYRDRHKNNENSSISSISHISSISRISSSSFFYFLAIKIRRIN